MARIGHGKCYGGGTAGLVRDGAHGKAAQGLPYPFLEPLVASHAA